jgi:hypothetical protein
VAWVFVAENELVCAFFIGFVRTLIVVAPWAAIAAALIVGWHFLG